MEIQIFALIVIGLIGLYFILKDNKKEQQYFSSKPAYTKTEQKILDHYKSIYTPLPADDRLPVIARDGYVLEDIAKTATDILYQGPIPTKEEIQALKKGDLIKLIFVDEEGYAERMWVTYEGIETDLHKGILDNDAFELEGLTSGKILYFHSNHVYQIDK
ncbi:MAG: hypothetical protein H7282_12490 [Cytophagaceae bacterium]|nr:hypothetical protein [Cytophagaceae bacterium]